MWYFCFCYLCAYSSIISGKLMSSLSPSLNQHVSYKKISSCYYYNYTEIKYITCSVLFNERRKWVKSVFNPFLIFEWRIKKIMEEAILLFILIWNKFECFVKIEFMTFKLIVMCNFLMEVLGKLLQHIYVYTDRFPSLLCFWWKRNLKYFVGVSRM